MQTPSTSTRWTLGCLLLLFILGYAQWERRAFSAAITESKLSAAATTVAPIARLRAPFAFATITVNGTADNANVALLAGNGTCDLREAIEASNTDSTVNECVRAGAPGLDTIQFNLGTGTPTINVVAPLPGLSDAVMILGDTGGATRVELNGAAAGAANGLEIFGGNTTIRALVINRFNGNGITISGEAGGNSVTNSLIGLNAGGTSALPNTGDGVRIASFGNTIGSTAAGAGNTIAFNTGHGILVAAGTGNELLGNSIFSNGSLGINLSDDQVTPNDPGDEDFGANNLQNFPVLAAVSGGVITGTLNSAASTTYRIEYFANSACDPSGNGEGEVFLGSQNVTTNGSGNASLSFSFTPVAGRNVFTATATSLSVEGYGNTSEFSACLTNSPPTITTVPVTRQQGSTGTVSTIATVSDAETPPGSLVVTVVSAPAGINVTGITNTNGTINANVAATCNATVGANTVVPQVSDGSGVTTGNLIVNVTANTPPALSYSGPQMVNAGGSLTVNPLAPPSDNNSINSITVQSVGLYTGTITVDPLTGVVTLTNAMPPGAHTITIRAIDNCNAPTDASFVLNVAPRQADLAITASGTPASAAPDTSVVYTLLVTNNGPAASPNTVVNDSLPAAFTAETVTTTAGSCTGVGTNTVNCNLGTLAVGAPVTITIQAHVPETCQPATAVNTAQVSGDLPDPNPANNTASTTTTVQLATLGPGACIPASSAISATKPGSLLLAGLFLSGASSGGGNGGGGDPQNNTQVNLTNVHPRLGVVVHLFFVDGETCSIADAFVCLTPQQTTSFLMSDLDPGTRGYMMLLAVDGPPGFAGGNNTGCPISFNYLIGNANIKFVASPRRDLDLSLEAVEAEFGSPVPGCDPNQPTVELVFDGTPGGYNQLPGVLAMSNIPSRADGNDTILMIGRVDGNWATGLPPIGSVFGIIYDDAENGFSFSFNVGTCLFRSSLSSAFPRTTPRLDQLIPAGRSGWLKFWSADGAALVGAMHNRNDNSRSSPSAFEGGHNLHVLRLLPRAVITVPIFPPSC